MKLGVEPGKYVVAVSGGVDSVVLLHALKEAPEIQLVVAHFDHGVRASSAADRRFVQTLAESYSLPFVYEEGRLGPNASEATARHARYSFLQQVQDEHKAQAIITAHHQDDVLETAIINMLRGTGRKGLSSLGSQAGILRPLLAIPKKDIIEYARANQLGWREDETNQDQAYLRNFVRHRLVPNFDEASRKQLLSIIESNRNLNESLDTLLVKYLPFTSGQADINRTVFNGLPYDVAKEAMAAWLRSHGVRDFDSQTLERLVVAAKTARPGDRFDIMNGITMKVDRDSLALQHPER